MKVKSADQTWGAFTNNGPWTVDRKKTHWLTRVPHLRERRQAEIPQLTKAPRIPPIGRSVIVLWHLGKAVGGWWLTKKIRRQSKSESQASIARRLRIACERLGVTYIKLAQIVSAGEGLFPKPLIEELKKCRDQVPPEPFRGVQETIMRETGQPLRHIFKSIETEAIAAASIAQVHRGELITGERVVVKVQRPGIEEIVRTDLQIMAWLAPRLVGRIPVTALANPPALVELFAETILEELDFRLEAGNMIDIAESINKLRQETYVVPRPHPQHVTSRMLVMEEIQGRRFDDKEGIIEDGVDPADIVRRGMAAFMEGALLEGIFHGDLHSGNLHVLKSGKIALLDFGITARLDEKRRKAFLLLMVSAATNNLQGQMQALRDLGALPADTDLEAVIKDLRLNEEPVDPTSLSGEEMVAEIQRVVQALLGYGARLPKELMLYMKNMLFLDGAIATLAPEIDILEEVTNISTMFTEKHGAVLLKDLGIQAEKETVDLTSVKAGLGISGEQTALTYKELQERRALIQKRMHKAHSRSKVEA